MVRNNRMQIILILLFFLGVIVFGQDKAVNEDQKLREEILAVYQSGGEQGLRDFLKKEKDKITNKFVLNFAKEGVKERKEEWLKICEIIANEKENEKTLADVLYQSGEYFRLIANNEKATEYFDKAIPIYLELNDPLGQGKVYLEKGIIRFFTGNNSEAFEMYDKALTFFKKAKDVQGQGTVFLRKGEIYLRNGEYSKALVIYNKALPFFEKAEDQWGQGNIFLRKGNIYLRMGENSKALKMCDRALFFYEKAGEPLGQGNVYNSKGNIYYIIGENSRASGMYYKALPFFKKAGSLIGQGTVYMNMGNIYSRVGENSKALEMYNRALPFFERAGSPIGQGNVLQKKGNIYLGIGENSKALEMYDRAQPFFLKAGEPLGQGHMYHYKGEIYLRMGENSKALEMYDKALLFLKRGGFPQNQGNVYLSKGDYYSSMGENLKALRMYDKALLFFERSKSSFGKACMYMNKGEIYFNIGDTSKALEMYEKALPSFDKMGAIEPGAIALHGKAKVFVKFEKKGEALDFFEKGIANLEKVRTQTAISEMKRDYMEMFYMQYEETVLFMLENKYYDKGFQYAESMKARVFLDRMAEGLVRLDKGLTPGLKEKRDNLVTKLSLLSKDIHQTAGGRNEKKLQELEEKYRRVENEFEELLIKIRLENPLYASVRYPQPISVQELQKEVLKKGEILVRYFISSGKLYVFLVSKKKFKVVALEVKKEEIKGMVKQYLDSIKENNSIRMKRYGKILYEKLFKPLEKRIKKSKDIIIIPDGELATIPFESLIIDNKKQDRPVFLLEKYRVKYLQSASLLKILRQHYQKNNRETNSFIGFGDPVYDYENFKLGKPEKGAITRSPQKEDEIKEIHRSRYARAGGIMDRLEASGEEVKIIARLFEKKLQKSVIRLRDKATEDNANKPEMKDFDYIHFTCHGLLNDDFQSLVLSQLPPGKSKEDGYFTLNEIMNCDYNAKLVVLSACQTGSGKLERAEGVTGMTRAVMYAGTPAVVATLWKVDDEATKELMVKFYENMLEKNLDKAEALRQAKLELLKNKKYRSPLFWSAFVMYGE